MRRRTHRQAARLALRSTELAFAAPQVIAQRLSRLAAAGSTPSARDRRESQRMVAEKPLAFAQAWSAMAVEAMAAQQALALAWTRSLWMPWAFGAMTPSRAGDAWARALLGVAGKGLAPVHRTAVANARRLSRARR
jgi:hypothetical protein